MSTAVEQTAHYCKKYAVLCMGANGRGECNTTACWNNKAGVRKVRLIDADALPIDIDYHDVEEAPTLGCWIPCSERLPEEEGEYLIWCVSYDVITGDKVTNAYGISYYDTQLGAWTGVHVGGFLWNEVFAWMTLPELYSKTETTTERRKDDSTI